MQRDRELEARVIADLSDGTMAYGDAALWVFRRLCALSGRDGICVGSGDFSVPLVQDLVAQPEITRGVLFGLSRRKADQLRADIDGDTQDRAIELHKAGLGGDGGVRIDTVLEPEPSPCAFMALHVPPGDLAPIEGAAGRLKADQPTVLIDMARTDGTRTGGQSADGGRAGGAATTQWRLSIAALLTGLGYQATDGFGLDLETAADMDGTGVLWAFPAGSGADHAPLVPLAVAKAAADVDAVARAL